MSRAAKLEMELEAVGGEPPAADRRLLPSPEKAPQAEAAKGTRRGERGEGRLRGFITAALCAAFLGLVRAGLETLSPSLRPRRRRCCGSTLGFCSVGVAVGLRSGVPPGSAIRECSRQTGEPVLDAGARTRVRPSLVDRVKRKRPSR